MSQPYVEVLVDFDIIDFSDGPLQLDDPILGLLDTGKLASSSQVNLTSLVKSVSVNRGRSRQLDQFNAGSAVVVFDNSTRILDPLNEDGAYYPNVLPRCPIQITANGIPIFFGLIVDWNLDYDITGQDIMTAVCSDDFTVLANQVFDAFTPSTELSGSRINTVLARPEIDYQGTRIISAGTRNLGDYPVNAGTNVLNYLQLVAKSEQGFLYTAANGTLIFKGSDDILNDNPNFFFSDDGTGIPYQSLLNQFGDELLYNYIITESPAGGPFVASDLNSQVRYQYQQLNLTDLLNSSSGVVENIGLFLLDKYKNPSLRFTGLSNQLVGLDSAHQNICLSVDLTDLCFVQKSFAVGDPSSVIKNLLVSGISHQIVPGSHLMNFVFESSEVIVEGAESDVIEDGYRIVTWVDDGSLTVVNRNLVDVEYLVVGGGGGGGANGGGGGAGGLLTNVGGTQLTLTNNFFAVSVGSGGSGGPITGDAWGSNGGMSSFGSISVSGGGGGGGGNQTSVTTFSNGRSGGSGGGGAAWFTNGTGGSGVSGQGNNGGVANNNISPFMSGGGGGASQAGETGGTVTDTGGKGGDGVSNSITGVAVTYGGGGGGGTNSAGIAGLGGTGGGGSGQTEGGAVPTAGTNGVGGGGGGGGGTDLTPASGASGGSGIVIVRWPV